MVLFLTEEDVEKLLDTDTAFDAARTAFRLLGEEAAENGVRQRVARAGATLNVMSAVAPPLGVMGVKTYPIVRTEVTQGSAFTYQLFDLATGQLTAVLRANVLGNMRTAAATALATSLLARADSRTLTVFGAGWVAREQAVATARRMSAVERVLAVGRSPQRLAEFCDQVRDRTGLPVEAVDAEHGAREADVIVTATGSRTPVFDGRWLRGGTHVNAVGSNYADKAEIDRYVIEVANVMTVDALDVARQECGDLVLGLSDWSRVWSLGAVLVGDAPTRTNAADVTLFASQGLAVLDLVAAQQVVRQAHEQGLGTMSESW